MHSEVKRMHHIDFSALLNSNYFFFFKAEFFCQPHALFPSALQILYRLIQDFLLLYQKYFHLFDDTHFFLHSIIAIRRLKLIPVFVRLCLALNLRPAYPLPLSGIFSSPHTPWDPIVIPVTILQLKVLALMSATALANNVKINTSGFVYTCPETLLFYYQFQQFHY